ncbi:hypothetical protein PSAC2689_10094 [Paraburkholderia sacchari]
MSKSVALNAARDARGTETVPAFASGACSAGATVVVGGVGSLFCVVFTLMSSGLLWRVHRTKPANRSRNYLRQTLLIWNDTIWINSSVVFGVKVARLTNFSSKHWPCNKELAIVV